MASLPTKEDRLNLGAERVQSAIQGVDYHTGDDILDGKRVATTHQSVAGTVSNPDQWLGRLGNGVLSFINRNRTALVGFGAGCVTGFLLRGYRER